MTELAGQEDSSLEEEIPRKSHLPFPVIGIGASAGGLPATIRLLEQTLPEPGMAYVVVLHLSPEHDSQAAAILQRATNMPVVQVTGTVPIEVNHVYVIAPALKLAMDDGHLTVEPLPGPRGKPIAIDLFFRTLALAHRERAIAVVLSGTGSDGAAGIAEVKSEGGVTLVQSPTDAEFEGMPSAAIATGHADFVLSAVEIADKLSELWSNAQNIELPETSALQPPAGEPRDGERSRQTESALRDIMAILASRTGTDFQHYKRGTVLRRLERRLQVTRQPNLIAYREYLDRHPQETAPLLQDMLISVTSFFRDRPAFEALERELMSELFGRRPPPSHIRAWVVACATGEEAYSLAMMMGDHLTGNTSPTSVQIFATDIDDRALSMARAGLYSEAIVGDVAPTRLQRFFDKKPGEYRIKKVLREQVMFAHQNILRDPPFSRLDLITCRNLLMYLERDVQTQVLELFHFALNPGGLLFLGTAETADFVPEHFTVVDKRNRIYRANPVRRPRRDLLPLRTGSPLTQPTQNRDIPGLVRAPLAQLHQRLAEINSPISVVIDPTRRILHSSPGASRYLRHAEGAPTQDLLDIVLPELCSPLRAALLVAADLGQSVAAKPVIIQGEQGPTTVHMSVRPGEQMNKAGGPFLIVFDEVGTSLSKLGDGHNDPVAEVLEREVRKLQSQLEGTLGDSVESSEALRASYEELQSMNEELRSATEELETSKEELQSINEELSTVNYELRTKVDETAKVNDDLNNLIASMNMATIFVDRNMLIKGFTPLSTQIFNIRPSDMGRSLNDLTHHLHYQSLAADVAHVIATLAPVEREIVAAGGPWYLMRVTPYRTTEDRINGAVLNFIDITERRAAQEELRARDERLRLVAENTEDYAVITLDSTGHVSGWNTGAKLMFGYKEEDIAGHHFGILFTPEDRSAGMPEQEMRTADEKGRAIDERWHVRQDGTRFYCSGITTPLLGGNGALEGYAKIARDLTERQLLERKREELLQAEQNIRTQLEAAGSLRAEFLAVMSHELKNPLNLILMSAELIGGSDAIIDDPELLRVVDTIRRTVHSQSQIIDDLLDLSRLTTGKLAINRSATPWLPTINRIVDAVRTEAAAKQIELTLTAAEDLTVYADSVRLEQILWNLISNAVKFTPPEGTVSVRLEREGNYAKLEVQDTGRGIESQFLPLVFNMFEQGDRRSSTRRDKGLGIGLALVKNLVELHEGSVEVRSEGVDQGSTFTVWLPLFEGETVERHENRRTPENIIRDKRVLLVEDDPDLLNTVSALLSRDGAEVTAAPDAAAALLIAADNIFDLVISDIAMPDMDGRQLIAALRKIPALAGMHAIAISGFGRREDAERSRAAGFDAHLNKPLSLNQLRETLLSLYTEKT